MQQPIPASASCLNALEALSHDNIHFLTVNEEGRALGVVTRTAISNSIQQQKNLWDMTVRSVTETDLPLFRSSDHAHTALTKFDSSKLAFYALDSGALTVISKQQLENALGLHIKQQLPLSHTPPEAANDESSTLPASCNFLDQPLKIGILGFTTSLTIHSFNQAALDILNTTEFDIENATINVVAERLPTLAGIENQLHTLSKTQNPEIRLYGPNNEIHSHLKLSISGVWDGDELRGYILTIQDTTEMTLAETRLRKLAYFDALTGLPNRLLFTEKLSGEINRCSRTKESFALLFADLDHFKTINDNYGHHVGDEVLRHFSSIVSTHLRACDTVGRLAGDEFTIILNGVKTDHDVSTVIEKIKNSLYNPLRIHGISINLEFSIGYAFFPQDGTNTESLIASADKNMYLEKRQKR
ncbi:diguanylate cyclase [Desulfovibrio mangrovi]|uniref:diguanylate cyclase domain-containing protein n=1 Tax=Desulfovibrio mangrovi TaxID=2976983 RepID=UPI002246F2D1|nr:diguanylate cyclase [Desulfovibrio mangrovi]UZP67591.1 diguanylate cyclase [Desulfovibrio mangrovi]